MFAALSFCSSSFSMVIRARDTRTAGSVAAFRLAPFCLVGLAAAGGSVGAINSSVSEVIVIGYGTPVRLLSSFRASAEVSRWLSAALFPADRRAVQRTPLG